MFLISSGKVYGSLRSLNNEMSIISAHQGLQNTEKCYRLIFFSLDEVVD